MQPVHLCPVELVPLASLLWCLPCAQGGVGSFCPWGYGFLLSCLPSSWGYGFLLSNLPPPTQGHNILCLVSPALRGTTSFCPVSPALRGTTSFCLVSLHSGAQHPFIQSPLHSGVRLPFIRYPQHSGEPSTQQISSVISLSCAKRIFTILRDGGTSASCVLGISR